MTREQRQKLRNAAKVVDEVAAMLDRSEQPCDCCGTRRKLNWEEFQAGVELDAIVRKLHHFAKEPA